MARRFLLALGLTGLVLLMGPVSAQEGGAGAGLIAGWNFDSGDGSQDVSGNGYNGTFMKQAAVRDSERGKVLFLDGVDDEFRAGAPFSTLDDRFFPPSAVAVSLWVKLEREPTGAADLFQYVSGGVSRLFVRINPGNLPVLYVHGRDGTRYTRSTKTMEVGKWHHLALSYEAAEGLQFYLDGELAAESISMGDLAWDPPYDSFRVGGYTGGARDWLNAEVDDIKIFGKSLAAEEVVALMEPSGGGLLAKWDFEAGGLDASGNGNDCNIGDLPVVEAGGGKGIQMRGDGDFADCGAGRVFENLKQFTYSAWVDLRAVSGEENTYGGIVVKDSQWSHKGIYINKYGQVVGYLRCAEGDAASISFGGLLVRGRRYHLAMSYDDTGERKLRLFVNGREIPRYAKQNACAGEMLSDAGKPLRISQAIPGRGFQGVVEEVSVYNQALGVEGVAALWEEKVVQSEEGLVAHYDFTEGGLDQGGYRYDGTFMKQAAVKDSERGKVLFLDGVDDEFRAGAPFSTLDARFFPPSSIAVSLWVKLEREPTGAADLFQYVSGGRSRLFVRVNPGNQPILYVHGRDGTRYIRSSKYMEVGKWHHLAVSYRADTGLQFYLDGELAAESISMGDLAWDPPYDSFRVGGYTGGARDWLNAEVDDIKIFGKGLSAEEVAVLMGPPVQPIDENFKTIAALEGDLRTFESLEENGSTLLLWGTYSNLFLAQIDASGNLLISAKRIVSSETHITGIAKPVPFEGGWLTAIRETNAEHVDQIRLLVITAEGEVSQNLVWLTDFERISLPIFLQQEGEPVIFYAASSENLNLYRADLKEFPQLPASRRIHALGGEVLYPPILMEASEGGQTALLIFHRGKNPPPMKVLFLGENADGVFREVEVPHDGENLRLSEPVFNGVNGEFRLAWFERISKGVPPRLIVLSLLRGGGDSKRVVAFPSVGVPSLQMSWVNGPLLGISHRPLYSGNRPAFLQTTLSLEWDTPSLEQNMIKPRMPEIFSSAFPKLLWLNRSRGKGLFLLENQLFHFAYLETPKKEKNFEESPTDLFRNFQECVNLGETKKQCDRKIRNRWRKDSLLKLFLEQNEKTFF